MNPPQFMRARAGHAKGFTLLELTMVMCILLVLATLSFIGSGWIAKWKAGRLAAETLRTVYYAQRTYLSDNPTTKVANLTQAMLLPYLPNSPATFPTIAPITGTVQMAIKVNVSPPYALDASGARYDPSGSTTDSLWDVGE